jgi:prolyl oligopeptidase PreP (S9A serine peptidase family)
MPESLNPPAINRSKSAVAGDPYRWLERAADPETAAWVTAQNELTQAWLAAVPARAQIRSQLGKQWNHARFGDAEWARDGSGFYYAAMDPPRPGGEYPDVTAGKRIFFHRPGTGGRLVCHYLRGACSLLRVAELDGTFVRDIPLPPMSTLGGNQLDHELIDGRPDSEIIYFEMVSFTSPAALYRHDLRSGETTVAHAPAGALDPREFITERVSVTSADGTAVPMFLTHSRGLGRRGDVPVLLCGYGGSLAGKPTAKAIAEAADRLAFLEGALGRTSI